MKRALVCGAGGFIAGHLVKKLKREGYWIRGVDIKRHEFTETEADEFELLDLRDEVDCRDALATWRGPRFFDEVYQLAANMGGMGHLCSAEHGIVHDNTLININMIHQAVRCGIERYFFSSSVCFAAKTLILTRDGAIPIEKVKEGDYVLTHKGHWRRVINTMSRLYSGKMVQIKSPGLPAVTCTADHPILSDNGSWIPASNANFCVNASIPNGSKYFDLGPIDRLVAAYQVIQCDAIKHSRGDNSLDAIRRRFGMSSNTVTKMARGKYPGRCDPVAVARVEKDFALGRFLGLYLANGWVESPCSASAQKRIALAFGNHKEHLYKFIQCIVWDKFGIPPGRVICHNQPGQKSFRLHITSQRLVTLVQQCFYRDGHLTSDKTLRAPILDSPREFLHGLVVGWWDGDGCWTDVESSMPRVVFSTTSRELAVAMRSILYTLGLDVLMQVRNGGLSHIQGREVTIKESYHLYVVGGRIATEHADSLLRRHIDTRRKVPDPRPISSSVPESLYSITVYNLDVEEDRSYIAEGMAVHNCTYRDMRPGESQLTEDDAYPALPDNEYGWEKLYAERIIQTYARHYPIQARIARFENCFGIEGAWHGGREKAPAALCRKVAEAQDGTLIEVWGNGTAIRSFVYVDDLVDGIYALMQSDESRPTNIGTEERVTIDELAQLCIEASGKSLTIEHIPGPVGVQNRNFSHERIRALGWEPKVSLREGIKKTYDWIKEQVKDAT